MLLNNRLTPVVVFTSQSYFARHSISFHPPFPFNALADMLRPRKFRMKGRKCCSSSLKLGIVFLNTKMKISQKFNGRRSWEGWNDDAELHIRTACVVIFTSVHLYGSILTRFAVRKTFPNLSSVRQKSKSSVWLSDNDSIVFRHYLLASYAKVEWKKTNCPNWTRHCPKR